MRNARWPRSPWFALLPVLAIGCAKAPVPSSGSRAVAERDAADNPAHGASWEQPEPSRLEPEFVPPFPQRENLFFPPKVHHPPDVRDRRRDSSVELKGFANADRIRALVMIDGRLVAVEPGQVFGNLEVLAIDPPQVSLRRNGRTWVETLTH